MKIELIYPLILGLIHQSSADHQLDVRKQIIKEKLLEYLHKAPEGIVEYEPDESKRGLFKKKFAESGLGNSFFKKQATSVSDLPEIYLCKKRKRGDGEEACCLGKNTECFTNGGCFCDESCQQYDDCCPDYNDTCSSLLDLCLTTEATPTGAPKGSDLNKVRELSSSNVRHHGVRATRVEPNKCCGPTPYNDGESCCCDGKVIDSPCSEDPCAAPEKILQ